MAVSVKPITLWRRELQDRPGALADSLEPVSGAGVNVKVLMAYRFPGEPGRAAVELYPISGNRATAAAERGGFGAASIPALLVEGDDAPGLGQRMSRGIADAGINLDFVVAQVLGGRYSAVFGFAREEDARRAADLIKQAGRSTGGKKVSTRKTARGRTARKSGRKRTGR
jgi:hypothetical protein